MGRGYGPAHGTNTFEDVAREVSLYRTCFLLLSFCPCAVAWGKQVSIHDPVMAKEGGSYFLFSTGPGITFYSSYDMKMWKLRGRVFAEEPVWARNVAKRAAEIENCRSLLER